MINLAKGTFYLSISSFLFMASGYAVNILLGRIFTPYEYGIYGVVLAFTTVINIIQTSGLPQAVAKQVSENESHADKILYNGLIVQAVSTICFTLLIMLISEPLARLLNDQNLSKYIFLSALIFPTYGIFALYLGYYNGKYEFKKQALVSIVYYFFKAMLAFALVFPFRLFGVLLAFIISPIFAIFSGFRIPRENIDKNLIYRLVIFSLPLIVFSFLSTSFQSIDIFFVKALSGSGESAGYYAASQNISRIIFFGLNAFSVVAFPMVSKNISENNPSRNRDFISKLVRYNLIILIPACLLISANSNLVIELLYTVSYSAATDSLSILVIGYGFLTLFILLSNILNGAGKPKNSMAISLVGVVIITILSYLFIPASGLVGAALATTIGSFVSMILAAYFVYKKFNTLINPSKILKILLASSVIYTLAKIIPVTFFFLPVLYLFLFGIYFLILYLIKEITSKDLKQVRLLIPAWVPFIN